MRMRLRAPDEPEAENGYEFGDANTSAPSTPEHTHLPPLDVGSPEYIEERLENLKRRPTWGVYLDQYVEDHPDSDSEAGDFGDISTPDNAGFIRSTLWSLLVVAFAPLLVLCAPCLKYKSYGFWPLGCRSMKELFSCALVNVIFMVFGLVLLYWAICREFPDVFNVNNTLVKLNVQADEIHSAADTCHAALLQWERMVAQELCMPVGIDVALLLLNTLLLLHYHRQWARYLMILMAVMFVVDGPTQLYDATFPAPEIHKVDPTFAMVDEELLVALDGKNLKPGGSVAWVAYWGCATTSNVDACDKQFASTFEAGNVAVTFKSLDHFIPCYRGPPNPLKAQDYQCFENIRIRVKDMQSIPGWSRTTPHAAAGFQAVKTESTLKEEWDNTEAPSFKHDNQVSHDAVNPEPRETETSLNTVKIDIAPAVDSSTEIPSTPSNGESELTESTVKLSEERGTQENESVSGSSHGAELESDNTEAVVIDEVLTEAEVMPDAVVSMRAIDDAVQNASQSEGTLAPVEVVSQDPATKVEELRVSSDTEVEVGVDKPKKHEEDIPSYNIEDPDLSLGDLRLEDAVVNEEILIIDDEVELSTMVVVVNEESVQVVLNDKDLELATDVEKHPEPSTYEAQSDKVSASVATAQKEEELELGTEVEKHTESSAYEAQSDEESASSATAEKEEELELATEGLKHSKPGTYEVQSEEANTPAATVQEEDELHAGLTTEGEEHPEPGTYEDQSGEESASAATEQEEEELEFAADVEKSADPSIFEKSEEATASGAAVQEEEELTIVAEAEKNMERSTFEAQSEEASTSAAAVQEEETLEHATEVEKHTKQSTFEAQSEEVTMPTPSTQAGDLRTSGSKEKLTTEEDSTSPAKKALSKLSEALSKISDSSGFASASISKKQKLSNRQGPRSRLTTKDSEPDNVNAAVNTAVVV